MSMDLTHYSAGSSTSSSAASTPSPSTPKHAHGPHSPSGHLFSSALGGLSHVSGTKQFFPSSTSTLSQPSSSASHPPSYSQSPSFSSLYTASSSASSSCSSSVSNFSADDDEPQRSPISALLYHRPSLPYYEEEEDVLEEPYCPSMTVSGLPSSVGLCDGRKGDKKNSGNLCAFDYGAAQCCVYCGRDLS